MTDEDGFLQAILHYPNDDSPRLIYADWLEEHDDLRGDFIRVQCRLAAMSTGDEERSRLKQYERELLARHQDRWLGELRPLLSGWTFRRGFLVAISVHAAAYLQLASIPQLATVRRVQVELAEFQPPQAIVELVPESVARENVVLPIGVRGRTLVMAAQEAQDLDMLAKLQFIFNRWVELVAADGGQIVEAINRLYGNTETESVDCVLYEFVDSASYIELDAAGDESPVAKIVALIIQEARALRADRIRIQPRPESIQVLYQIDYRWVERDAPPKRLLAPIVARIRQLAGLPSIDEGRVQTGLIRVIACGRFLELTVRIRPMDQGPSIWLMF